MTTESQENEIKNQAIAYGDTGAFRCAFGVSKALNGFCGISESFLPGTLNNQAKGATCK